MKVAAATGALLERSDELARIESALADARTGRGRFVVVEGPAGIGKTALLAAARTAAAEGGMRVLRSRATEDGDELRLRSRAAAVRAAAGRGIGARARRSAARRCRRCGRAARAPGRTTCGWSALFGRRSLVRDPPRPLLAVREPRRGWPALLGGRRCALGRRRVSAVPGVPAHAARRAGHRARRRDPPSRSGHRSWAAHDPDDRFLRRCDPSRSLDKSRRRPAARGRARSGSGSGRRRYLPARNPGEAVPRPRARVGTNRGGHRKRCRGRRSLGSPPARSATGACGAARASAGDPRAERPAAGGATRWPRRARGRRCGRSAGDRGDPRVRPAADLRASAGPRRDLLGALQLGARARPPPCRRVARRASGR